MEAEQVAALNRLDGLIDVKESDFIEGTIDGNAARASGNGYQSGFS